MNKKAIGITIQIVGVILWVALPVKIVPWKALLGIGMLIAGGIIFRQGKS